MQNNKYDVMKILDKIAPTSDKQDNGKEKKTETKTKGPNLRMSESKLNSLLSYLKMLI